MPARVGGERVEARPLEEAGGHGRPQEAEPPAEVARPGGPGSPAPRISPKSARSVATTSTPPSPEKRRAVAKRHGGHPARTAGGSRGSCQVRDATGLWSAGPDPRRGSRAQESGPRGARQARLETDPRTGSRPPPRRALKLHGRRLSKPGRVGKPACELPRARGSGAARPPSVTGPSRPPVLRATAARSPVARSPRALRGCTAGPSWESTASGRWLRHGGAHGTEGRPSGSGPDGRAP